MIELISLTQSDIAVVENAFADLATYQRRVGGPQDASGAARSFLTDTPRGVDAGSKHNFAILQDAEQVGLIDLIENHPRKGCGYIGLFAILESFHRRGLGRAAYEALEAHARDLLRLTCFRLGVVDSNDVHGFWLRVGFHPTGERSVHGDQSVTIMERSFSETV